MIERYPISSKAHKNSEGKNNIIKFSAGFFTIIIIK